MSDMMERNALSMAQSLATQTEMLCRQAQNVSPFVQPIGHLTVAQGYVTILIIQWSIHEAKDPSFGLDL